MDATPHIASLDAEALLPLLQTRAPLARIGEARRLIASHFAIPGGGRSCRPVGRATRDASEALVDRQPIELVEEVADDSDGFVKLLFRLADGALCEAVRIPLHKPGCFSVCLSSQVGCAMGCDFCATGRLGLRRDLAAWEIVEAFRLVRNGTPGRVSGAVFMGQGEPLDNYDAVLQAARVISLPYAGRIASEAISISTVGVVPAIQRYASEGHRYRLIVSLTSAIDSRRARLMPVSRKWGVADIAAAVTQLHARTGQRQTLAWVILAGVNTGADEVEAIARHFGHLPLRINLIDVNDARPQGYTRADEDDVAAFVDRLKVLGVPIVRRYSGGAAKHAACGMLAARHVAHDAGGLRGGCSAG